MTVRPTTANPVRLATFALANELSLAADPREIVMPYGRWPYGTKDVALPDGTTRKVFVTQKLRREGAANIARALADAVAAGAPGLPIYQGHPDVPEVAGKFPDKRAIGWARTAEDTADGLRLANIVWNESPKNGFGWFSPYWFGGATWIDADNVETDIDELRSVGLTNNPNILDFRLANEAGYAPDTKTDSGTAADKDKTMDREMLIKTLGLPPEATDEQILAEIVKLKTAAADAATKVEAANAEAAAEKADAEKAKTALANERKARAGLLLDAAIGDGRIGVASRPAWAKRLGEDFDAGAIALANERPLKTRSVASALDPAGRAPARTLLDLANEKVRAGTPFADAWASAKREHPELLV